MNLDAMLKRLKALGGTLSTSQLVSLAVAFVTVAGLVVGSAYLVKQETFVLLFADLDAEAASSVVSQLKSRKVPFELADGGRSVRVPEGRVDELRLDFASGGLPASGRIGFEIFDHVSFGATEFLEQVNYRRALEGELARTISTLSEVAGARVHIAPAKNSLFESQARPATASVVLKLRSNRPPAPATISGVSSLVAAAVEGLRPEAVVVLDSYGRPLSRTSDEAGHPGAAPSMERQLMLERELTDRVIALLEPVLGAGRVRVNVAARLNGQSEEQTEERWDPDGTVVRGRQTSSDGQITSANMGGGVAGARANLPPPDQKDGAAPAPKAAQGAPPGTRTAETTNYEISRVVRHTVRPRGDIARLSVAVIVDDKPAVTPGGTPGPPGSKPTPRTPEDLQKIGNLVSAAVGLDPARGDQVTVENLSFDERASEGEFTEAPWWERYAPKVLQVGRLVVVLLLGLLAMLMVVRPAVRRALAVPPVLPGSTTAVPALPRTIQDLESAIEAELDAASVARLGEHAKVPVLSRRLGLLTQQEPARAANLVRSWLEEDTQ
ncbi:MAG: flagellar basal-body MS-ring/collar protein FliF [Acidobacteriota bacterium]